MRMRTRHAGLRRTQTNAKSGLFGIRLDIHLGLPTYFSLKYWLQMNSVRLFTKCSPHKQMLFPAPWLHIHINISFISARLIRHSRTGVERGFTHLIRSCGQGFTNEILRAEFRYHNVIRNPVPFSEFSVIKHQTLNLVLLTQNFFLNQFTMMDPVNFNKL